MSEFCGDPRHTRYTPLTR
uniref:Uncharacterized protein n=1 Tax=Anguilla anguilla TaxID=7936 RepID=A0A0E9S1Y1_ANGAN